MGKIECSIEDEGGVSNIYLLGDVAEDFNSCHQSIIESAKGQCRFFLSEISSINEPGAQSWNELFSKLPETCEVKFEDVNYIVLEECCRNPDLLSWGEVLSFYLDLECEPCEKISSIKFTNADSAESALEESGLFVCEVCDAPLDVVVDAFPAFLDLLRAQ